MTAKQYLAQVHIMRKRAMCLKIAEEDLRIRAEGLRAIVYDKDKVQVSASNKLEELMGDIIATQEQYAECINELHRDIQRIEAQIATMQTQYAEVLRLRYIDFSKGRQLTLAEIAREMAITYGWARHLHGIALQAFDKKYLQHDTSRHI